MHVISLNTRNSICKLIITNVTSAILEGRRHLPPIVCLPFQSEILAPPSSFVVTNLSFHDMIEEAKQHINHDFFMEVFIIGFWRIWKQQNVFLFDRVIPSFQSWKQCFINETLLQSHWMSDSKRDSFRNLISLYS
jgi:hypothetical protein